LYVICINKYFIIEIDFIKFEIYLFIFNSDVIKIYNDNRWLKNILVLVYKLLIWSMLTSYDLRQKLSIYNLDKAKQNRAILTN